MLSASLHAERTLARLKEDGHFYREALLIPETSFSINFLRSLGSGYLARFHGRYGLVCVYFCTKEMQAGPYLTGIGGTDGSYQTWLSRYRFNQRFSKSSAQLLAIGSDAAIRYVDKSGKVGLLIFHGQNPYSFQVGRSSYEVVNVALLPPPRNTKDLPARGFDIVFYVKAADGVAEAAAMKVLDHFAGKLRVPLIDVLLRGIPGLCWMNLRPCCHLSILCRLLPRGSTGNQRRSHAVMITGRHHAKFMVPNDSCGESSRSIRIPYQSIAEAQR